MTSLYSISWAGNPEKLKKQPGWLGHVVWKYCYQGFRVSGFQGLRVPGSQGLKLRSVIVLNRMIKEKSKQRDVFALTKSIRKREK